ncbi:Histidine kinase-, DNA gyrase B-, and HSP90-like ATPase [Bizionia echini]|uniref:histidine kinase n=1 Tax=Bizionia echini TaxID=649333 RepID=A0A1I5D0B2_9FLAO|nr:tetratricopeptide repeat protein [Bizionia echini]SFN92546.1 Histidine kinase-, DNA gyrase B-, and HSP90-like ATPase [Bizionia echini]
MNYFICIVLVLFSATISWGQNRAQVYNDSALDIYKTDSKKAIVILEQGLMIAEKEGSKKEKGRILNSLGIVYRDLGEFEKSKELSLESLKNTNDSLIVASAYNNLGVVNRNLGFYEEAVSFLIKALSIYDAKGMMRESAVTNNNIGIVYSFNDVYDKAVEYHLKAKGEFEKLNDKKGASEAYNNIAIVYANNGDLKKALEYFKYSLKLESELKDKKGVAESLNNIGGVYYYLEEVDSSLVYFEKSAELEKEIGNYSGVGSSYNNIAQVLIEKKRAVKAKPYIDSAFVYAQTYKVVEDIQAALQNYSDYYQANNLPQKALEYYKRLTNFKDSIQNLDVKNKIAELEIEYQTEKKEKEILKQRADLAEKERDISEKNSFILGLVGLATVISLLGFLVYNQQKLKNRQLKKESELKEALIKIETQNRLQDQRLRISRDLHDNIGAQLTFIISSLDNLKYGFKLPDNLTAKLETISQFTTATIYELRDTIWAMNKTEISFEDLQSRISNFIEKANSSSDAITFNFRVDQDVDSNKLFTSVQGMNIYRIIQESVNNALKYAKASIINVQFLSKNHQFEMTITDNGIGFNPDEVLGGNGLLNIKKRTHELDAELEIISSENKGTTIRVFKILNT